MTIQGILWWTVYIQVQIEIDGGDEFWLWSLSLVNQQVSRLSLYEGRQGHSREEELEQSHGYMTSTEAQGVYTSGQDKKKYTER